MTRRPARSVPGRRFRHNSPGRRHQPDRSRSLGCTCSAAPSAAPTDDRVYPAEELIPARQDPSGPQSGWAPAESGRSTHHLVPTRRP